jgi:hypothetical protein
MEKKVQLHITPLKNRQYILSPAVQSGNDRECTNKDFYQEGENCSISLGKLGVGMKVVHRKTTVPYTIIHFDKERVSKFNLSKKINSTLNLMYKSSHPYLFRLLNHYETETHVFMIFESYDGESLEEKILKDKCDLQNTLMYLVEIMLGVQHLHEYNLYNVNVNPENILVNDCVVKLTDYGLKMEGKNQKPKRNNILLKKENINYIINAYTSPEELNAILNKKPCILNGKTDTWNCGILLYEMLTKFGEPFKGKNNDEFINAILNCEIDLEPIKDDFCRELISKMVRKNPEERIDIDEILNMDYIKNVDIEQFDIDFSDNIINPIYEQNQGLNSENNNQTLNKELTNLKSENDNLKQLVEDLKKQVNSSNKKKKPPLKHFSKLKSMVIDVGSEIVADDGLNLDDMLNEDDNDNNKDKQKSENKMETLKKSMKHEVIEEEEDDDEEDYSDKEEEFNDDNLFVRSEKYKERNNQLREKLRKLSKKNKKLKSSEDEYKKQIEELNNNKNKNILETLEKINTVPIYHIDDLVNVILNSINIFKNTQNEIKNSVDKLISNADSQEDKLKEENKKFLDNKTKLFFDIMNNKISEKEALDEINKKEKQNENQNENNINEINDNFNQSEKNLDYKEKYEESKRKEEILDTKVKVLEESVRTANELKNSIEKEHEELKMQFQQFTQKSAMTEMKIQDLKNFINENVDKEKAQRFFKDLDIN